MPTLNWIGKEAVINHHLDVKFRLLKDVPELGCGDPGSGNLIVEGDNLVALKALLPYYRGRVKCICIDPPYNTGNEGWAYNDNVNSPAIRKWIGDTVGGEGETLDRHDRWLCMMYPRLALLREFLREDGMIFVNIDENEHRFAELLMDEVFGPANRIITLIWKKSYGGGAKSKHVVNLHEYVHCFARNKERIGALELPPDEGVLKYYKLRDRKFAERGPFRLQPLATNSMDSRPNLRYSIPYGGEEIWPEKQWQWSKDRAFAALSNDELVITKSPKGKWTVNYKQYLRDTDGDARTSKLYSIIEGIYTQQGTNEISDIFGDGKLFSFPKPSNLIAKFIEAATNPGDLVLDSFAGSGTTGHAVLKMNAAQAAQDANAAQGQTELQVSKDGTAAGTAVHPEKPVSRDLPRRFILVEMEPKIAQDITRERVKRVAEGYKNAKGEAVPGLGGGFRYVRLGEELFDEHGRINEATVRFADLARHVYFSETGEPLVEMTKDEGGRMKARKPESPLLGIHHGRAVYLLYNGILKDKSVDGGNVLTTATLEHLPAHAGPRVVYAAGCRFSKARLEREGITFKQTPYAIRTK